MKDSLIFNRSSFLVSTVVLLGGTVLCVLAAFFGQLELAAILMFLVVMSGLAKLWAFSTARGIRIQVSSGARGLFPGEQAKVEFVVENKKF